MRRLVHITTVPDSLLFLRGQRAFMATRGYALEVVSSPGERLDRFALDEGVRATAVNMPRAITPAQDLRAVGELAAVLMRDRPDIVHAHTPKGGLLGMLAARIAGVPLRIYHMRGLPMMTASGSTRALLANTERLSCRLAHHVICVSRSLREVAIAEKLVPADKIEVLLSGSGQGVDTRRFDPIARAADRPLVRAELGIPADALVFGFVGRLVGDKGVGELASAWQAVRVALPGAFLVVVGEYEPRDPVPESVRTRLEGDPTVKMVGFRRDTERWYAAMDVVVLPTYREGFPNVPLEGASMGLPVVSTRVPGCVDAVADGLTGTLVEARDADGLAASMLAYGRDPALRSAHGAAGRARVLSEFDRERIWAALADVYDRFTPQIRVAA